MKSKLSSFLVPCLCVPSLGPGSLLEQPCREAVSRRKWAVWAALWQRYEGSLQAAWFSWWPYGWTSLEISGLLTAALLFRLSTQNAYLIPWRSPSKKVHFQSFSSASWIPSLNCIAGGKSVCMISKSLPKMVSGAQHDQLCTLGKVRKCMLELIRYAKHSEHWTWNKGETGKVQGKESSVSSRDEFIASAFVPSFSSASRLQACISFWPFSPASEVSCFCSDVFPMPSLMLPDYRCGQNILQDTQLTNN